MKRSAGLRGLVSLLAVAAMAAACGGSSNGAKVVSSEGSGGPRAVGEDAFEIGKAALSPDGTRLVELTGDADELHLNVIDTVGSGTIFQFAKSSQTAGEQPMDWAWSPDGETIAALRTKMPGTSVGEADVVLVSPQGGDERTLAMFELSGGAVGGSVAWAPDGKSIAVVTQHQGVFDLALVDAASGQSRWLGDRPIGGDISWSPDGQRVAIAAADKVQVVALDGAASLTMDLALLGASFISWSPDGARLALCGIPNPQVVHGMSLFILDPGTGKTTKTFPTSCNSAPAWSPDGDTVAVTSETAVTLVEVATGKETELTHMDGKELRSPNWSRDGKSIYFVTRRAYRD